MLQRYSYGDACGGEYPCQPQKDPDGVFVYYEDVAPLEAALNRIAWENSCNCLDCKHCPRSLENCEAKIARNAIAKAKSD